MVWAIPNHPWVDEAGEADVRVAMTVIARDAPVAMRIDVEMDGSLIREQRASLLNADLSVHADVATAATMPLLGNEGLASRGFQLIGRGFILSQEEAESLVLLDPRNAQLIKSYLNGRDLSAHPRGVYLIDFALCNEAEARQFSTLYDLVRDRVKPDRDANSRASYREYWWRFGEPRRELREAVDGLERYIATVETSRHRFFTFLEPEIAPDNMLVCVALDSGIHLGVLSSLIHVTWATSAGGRLGIGNDPRYNKTRCFDPFPFPDPPPTLATEISAKAEHLDRHRKDAIERDDRVTMTGMYNVVQKLRSGEALTAREREIHESAACGVLRELHDELDSLVAQAYGWPWPMEREEMLEKLVALHDERVSEEQAGKVHWLRPDYQIPRFGKDLPADELPLGAAGPGKTPKVPTRQPWPGTALGQLAAIKEILEAGVLTEREVTGSFVRPSRPLVRRHLDTLVLMGELVRTDAGRYSTAPATV